MSRSARVDGAVTKKRLLDAAVQIVAEKGLSALTHRAVASEADLPVASAVYHLRSSSELRTMTLEHAADEIGQVLADKIRQVSDRDEGVAAVCAEYALELVRKRRAPTITVFTLLINAVHDERLGHVATRLNDQLSQLLLPVAGSAESARNLGAAVQGQILVSLVTAHDDGLEESIIRLIGHEKYCTRPPRDNDGLRTESSDPCS